MLDWSINENFSIKCPSFFTFFNNFYFANVFFLILKNVRWKYHLKSVSKQRKQIGSVWLFFFVPMLEFPYRPIYWLILLDVHGNHHHHQRTDLGGIMSITSVFTIVPCNPLCKILNTPVMSICLVKQNDGTWVEKHQLFYSTFTNVFYIYFSRFFTFFNVFLFFFWNVFTSMVLTIH